MKKNISKIIASIKIVSTHINKKRFKSIIFASLMLLILVVMIFLVPTTLSKYTTSTNSSADVEVAFYLLKTDYQTSSVLLDEIAPRNEPYIYNFTISNFNSTKRTETNLEYDLSIKTTTNLPLSYDLYLNSNYTDANADQIITEKSTIQDDYGTYFNMFSTNTKYFSHSYDETNRYQLVVYFPETYIDEMYQDIVDLIEIRIESRQVMDE